MGWRKKQGRLLGKGLADCRRAGVCDDIQFRIMPRIVSQIVARGLAGDDINAGKGTGEKGFEPCVAIQHATVASADHIRDKPREHDFVADSLLAPNQQTPRCQLFAGPERLRIARIGVP
jgi:hypothetical protein